MSANEELRSLSIRHGVYLERYTRNEALRLSRLLESAVKELETRILATNGAITRDRLNNMVANARDLLTQATRAATGQLSADMDELARYELDRALADLRSAIPGEITTVGIAPEQALSAIRAFPATEGFLMNDLFERWGRNTVDAFTTQIRLGVLEGDTVNQLVQRIRGRVVRRATSTRPGVYEGGVVGTSTRGAEALARTAVAHINATVRDEIYKANEDIIKGYQYVATLDSATCLVCAPLDGKVYETGEPVPMLPQHYNCRCLLVPVTKSYKELGLDIDEIAPGTRSSMNGYVPEKTTYQEWLAGQPAAIQNDILGPGRADLFRSGTTLSDMRDRAGNVLTLERLRELDK